jgi:hypothetical protein
VYSAKNMLSNRDSRRLSDNTRASGKNTHISRKIFDISNDISRLSN